MIVVSTQIAIMQTASCSFDLAFDLIFRTQREIEAEQKRRAEEARDRERILKLREIEREHRKHSEKLIKEAEEREMKQERRKRATEVNQKIKEATAKEIYARQIEGKAIKKRHMTSCRLYTVDVMK